MIAVPNLSTTAEGPSDDGRLVAASGKFRRAFGLASSAITNPGALRRPSTSPYRASGAWTTVVGPGQAAKPRLISEGARDHQCEAHFNPSKKAGLHCSVPFRSSLAPRYFRPVLLVRPSWNSRRAHAVMVRIGVS